MIGTSEATLFGDAAVFRGIPYADACRFRVAVPFAADEVIDARVPGPAAPQPNPPYEASSSETDCLHLTVWSPGHAQPPTALPVLVWIHGGAHMYGASHTPETDGARLAAQQNLIIVSVNYRLGAFGHLWLADTLGDDFQDSGNLALHDQLAALRWVRDHIASFGGDPKSVTLMGQSSGGVDVLAHLSSATEEALFHRAIVHSATAERTWAVDEAIEVRDELLAELGAGHPTELLTLAPEDVMRAQEMLTRRHSARLPTTAIPFRPIVDHRLLHASPLEMLQRGAGCDIPLLIGTNTHDAASWVDRVDEHTSRRCLEALVSHRAPNLRLGDATHAFHTDNGWQPTAAELLETLLTDLLYRLPTQRVVAARGNTPTYVFKFDYRDADQRDTSLLPAHSAELPFVFQTIGHNQDPCPHQTAAASVAHRMGAAWATFAREGRPSSENEWLPSPSALYQWGRQPRPASIRAAMLSTLLEDKGVTYKSW